MRNNDFHENEQIRKETISAYLDDDLSADDALIVGDHIAGCKICNDYLNSLKLVSTSLEIMLGTEPVGVPGEFSRRVTAAAESDVGGLRSSIEGSRAILTAAILFSLLAFVIAAGVYTAGYSILEFSGRSFAYLALLGHFLYTASITVSMVLATVFSKLLHGPTFLVAAVVVALSLSFIVFSKHKTRFNRS